MLTEDTYKKVISFKELYKRLLKKEKFNEELTKSLLEELTNLKFIEIQNDNHIL